MVACAASSYTGSALALSASLATPVPSLPVESKKALTPPTKHNTLPLRPRPTRVQITVINSNKNATAPACQVSVTSRGGGSSGGVRPTVEPAKPFPLYSQRSKNVTVRFSQSRLASPGYMTDPAIVIVDGGSACGVRRQELVPTDFPKERGASAAWSYLFRFHALFLSLRSCAEPSPEGAPEKQKKAEKGSPTPFPATFPPLPPRFAPPQESPSPPAACG